MEPWMVGALIGAVGGLLALTVMTAGKSSRDVVMINAPGDILGAVRGWAAHHGYEEKGPFGPAVRFQRGKGFLVSPMVVDVSSGPQGHRLDGYTLMRGLGTRREMAFTNTSMIANVPRKKGLREFNALITSLGHPPLSR